MKPYRAFSRYAGPHEAAILVLHKNIREAKRLVWHRCGMDFDEYIDIGIRLIRDTTVLLLANQEKLQAYIPHIIGNPLSCTACGLWGQGITEDNLCSYCNEHPGNNLIQRLTPANELTPKAITHYQAEYKRLNEQIEQNATSSTGKASGNLGCRRVIED